MTRVKICGVTNVEDALLAAELGASAIGLVFWPGTPRRVEFEQAIAIASALPAFVSIVGLFVDPQPAEVRAALDAVALDILQFHGDEPQALCASFGRRYIKAVPVRPDVDLLQYASRYPDARGMLFDAFEPGGMPGGTGRTFDWQALAMRLDVGLAQAVVLSGGLTPHNVGSAIRALHPWAVDVSSGVEATGDDGRPHRGIKDPAKIAAFIRGVRDADG